MWTLGKFHVPAHIVISESVENYNHRATARTAAADMQGAFISKSCKMSGQNVGAMILCVNYLLERLKASPALRHELCKGRQGSLGYCWPPAGDDLTDDLQSQESQLVHSSSHDSPVS